MKQHILKCAALAMALCMMVSVAAGCGGDPDEADSSNKTTATTTAASDEQKDDTSKTENSKTQSSKTKATKASKTKSSKTQSGKTQSKDNDTNVVLKGLPTDLKGATINVAGMSTCYWAKKANAKSEWDRQIYKELQTVKKNLNCKFKFSSYDSKGLTEQCIKADKAGAKFADLMVTTLWQQQSLIAAKAIQDLNAIEHLDLTKGYWDQASHREAQLYGKNFIAYTSLDGTGANANVIYFNKTLLKQVGSSDTKLYKMVTDGTWTFDTMRKLSKAAAKDIDGKSGMTSNDQWGFTGVDIRGGVSYSIFKAQGGYFTKTNSSGDITYALGDAKNIAALQLMQSWLLQDTSVYNADNGKNDHEIGVTMFNAGRVLFLGWSADAATNFTKMKNDWGIVPYPKAEKNGKYVSVISWNTQGFSVPRKVKGTNLQNVAAVMDATARQLDKIRSNKEAYMAKYVYRDSQTQKMLNIAEESASIDLCQFADLGAGGLSTIHYLFDNISYKPATRVKSVQEEATSKLNAFLKQVK